MKKAMFRKLKVGFLLLVLILSLSACGCDHTWQGATCESPRSCTLCGVTEGELGEHQWRDEARLVCAVCGLNEEITEDVICVDLSYRKAHTCLTKPEEITEAIDLVEAVLMTAELVPEQEVSEKIDDMWHGHFVEINDENGPFLICISNDCSLIWTEEEEGGRAVWALNPEDPLVNYLEMVTDGVKGEKTSGTAFAAKETPWDWTANISAGAVEKANIYYVVKTEREGNSVSTTTSSGSFASREFGGLLEVLNKIPGEAFSEKEMVQRRTFSTLYTNVKAGEISVYMIDRVNSLAVVLCLKGDTVEMIFCDDLEKVEQRHTYLDGCVTYWNVEDEALTAYLTGLMENPPIVNHFVGHGYDWSEPMEFMQDGNLLKLSLVEGWEYEAVSEAKSFGVRCRPEGVTEGWLYFSFWPEGYEPQEENRYYSEGGGYSGSTVTSYPSTVSTKNGVDTTNAIWSFYRARTENGDFAVINQGADDWFLQHEQAIEDTITFCQYS